MDNTVMVAIISGVVVLTGIGGQMLSNRQQSNQRQAEATLLATQRLEEKEAEYARQDEVAKRLEEAAELTRLRAEQVAAKAEQMQAESLASAAVVNERLTVAAESAAKTAAIADEKLNVIHTLVNSTLTTAMQNELNALIGLRAAVRENLALKLATGDADPSAQQLLAEIEEKIDSLKVVLHDRDVQTILATAELLKAKGLGPEHAMTMPPPAPPTPAEVTHVTAEIADVQAQTPTTVSSS